MDWSAEFPFAATLINCNNAGVCPPPLSAAREGMAYLETFSRRGFAGMLEEYAGRDGSLREKLARLLGTTADRIALTHNTSEGINTIAHGFPFKPGDRILTAGKEYPANIFPWMNLAGRGVHLDLVAEGPDGSLPPEKFAAAIRPETALISVSFVQWCSGYRVELAALAELAHAHGIPLVVDGAQGVGALALDVEATGIDALACSAWKWLWGPLGLGFLWMKPEFMARISPPFVGADGVAPTGDPLSYQLTPAPGMLRFEYATKNYGDIIVFDRALDLTLQAGIAWIEKELLELTEAFRREVESAGYRVYGDYPPSRRSGIISFTAGDDKSPEAVLAGLKEHGVQANVRDGRIRLSPHVYMGRESAARFGDILKRL